MLPRRIAESQADLVAPPLRAARRAPGRAGQRHSPALPLGQRRRRRRLDMIARRELKASGAKRIARASRNPATRKARPDKMNKPSELPIRDLERATGERATGNRTRTISLGSRCRWSGLTCGCRDLRGLARPPVSDRGSPSLLLLTDT
jgi:hypothetical protein